MMFSPFERLVAMRYLRSRRSEGFISVIAGFSFLGIMLGVATLIIVMAVMNGFRQELLGRILGLNGHVEILAVGGGGLGDFDVIAGALERVPGVVSAIPVVDAQVMATANGVASGALVRGLRADDFRARPLLAGSLVGGGLASFAEGEGIIVGSRLAARLRVRPGDRLKLISPQGTPTALGTVPRVRAFEVAATFNVGMFEYDNALVFMPLALAQRFFRRPEQVSGIEVMIDHPDHVARLVPALREAAGEGVFLRDWRVRNNSYFNALQVERNVMFLILTLIILVAAFNIISSLIMLVKDKGRDIAILRTMGATRGMVMRIFFLSGASVGVAGTLAGLGIGLVFCANIETIRRWLEGLTGTELFAAEIYFLSRLPAEVETGDVIAITAMALGLSLLATIYPSWRAALLDPVVALRNE